MLSLIYKLVSKAEGRSRIIKHIVQYLAVLIILDTFIFCAVVLFQCR